MITLHDVHKQGSESVKTAVLMFGARHPLNNTIRDAGTDWDQAEQHFTLLAETIMGAATAQDGAAATVRRAENEAINFLLAVSNLSNYRCPICVRRQAPTVSPRPTLETT
ncbi:hypothetical protein ACFYWO_01675 [Streptomyces sp. NPDC002932]|uniref:hypothetical protein n=1 Tax=Streptomyces sp. NPDC002932 TaxID=3364672 RepID=UPI0036B89A57